ncbi:hypothetical protein BDY21DRAFT_6132 [Lineolata rhizophorae]|uniref:Uncharacterized protein n=1 Tax=Lineolata rhizophorae TaxID=578093 RepID=A0A6A6PDH9_9PEZI|nr:hypothetical protein BDY21DRAFT_6132 [Lineolata rhizophorae]
MGSHPESVTAGTPGQWNHSGKGSLCVSERQVVQHAYLQLPPSHIRHHSALLRLRTRPSDPGNPEFTSRQANKGEPQTRAEIRSSPVCDPVVILPRLPDSLAALLRCALGRIERRATRYQCKAPRVSSPLESVILRCVALIAGLHRHGPFEQHSFPRASRGCLDHRTVYTYLANANRPFAASAR